MDSHLRRNRCYETDACLIGLLAILPHSVVAADPDPSLKVVIVRHGEKPPKKDDNGNAVKDNGNLSCAGLNRSLKLPDVIVQKFGVPNHIYAPKLDTGSSTGHARMFQTASPLAALYNLKINTTFEEDDTDDAATAVKSKKKVVLMVWEHSQIPALANSLEPNPHFSQGLVLFVAGTAEFTLRVVLVTACIISQA